MHESPGHGLYLMLLALCLLLAMLIGWGMSWYLIDPASPYNKEAEPLMERAIYSDHMHH